MEQQMEMDFGLNTTNQKVDPVSGNEIPPGSMPEEVRDDVDAKLSQGEYVVPADVVRFFGVKFFEDLRTKAKMGLDKMDKTGRINGKEPEMEEDDFPFSDEELMFDDDEEDTEMAAGGFVNPYQAPIMPQAPQVAQGKSNKKQDKVNVRQPVFTTGMAAPYGPSSLTRTAAAPIPPAGTPVAGTNPTDITWKTYKDSSGNIITVPFSGDTPLVAIPPGYTPAEATKETPQYYDPNDNKGDHGTNMQPDTNRAALGENRKTTPIEENPMRSREALEDWADKRASGMMNVGTGLGAVAGAVLGGGALGGIGGARKGDQIFDRATYNAAAQMAEYRGWNDLAESFREKAGSYETGLLGNVLSPGTGTSSRFIKDWEATSGAMTDKGTTGNNTGSDSIRERTGTSGYTAGTSRPDSERDSGGYSAPDMPSGESAGARGVGSEVSERSSETYANQVNAAKESGSVSNSTAAGLSGQQSTNPGGFDEERGEWASGPMAKGGLVSKPKGFTRKNNNNKKTRKGLASK